MEVFKRIPLHFEEQDYEIRVLYDDTSINVVTFLNNHPANGYRHQIQLPKNCNVEGLLKNYPLDELIENATGDITEKRWENLSKIIQETTAAAG